MIKLKHKGQSCEFKNWREAHYETKDRNGCAGPCLAATLDHYSDFEMLTDDFGNEIGRECVEHNCDITDIEVIDDCEAACEGER